MQSYRMKLNYFLIIAVEYRINSKKDGNYDLWKNNILDKGDVKGGKRFNN